MNPLGWLTASELRQQLQSGPHADRSVCFEQVRWLGRYGLTEELELQLPRLRSSPHWDAELALEVSLGWLLTGHPHRSDLAFLEADRLDPSLALVPDVWGLWPAPLTREGATPQEHRAAIETLATQIRGWRHLEPRSLDATWRQHAQADWTATLRGPALNELVLLLRQGDALEHPIEPFLADLVGETAIETSPGQAQQFWAVLTDIRPDWPHARIKAADLSLASGELARCIGWITTASPETQRNPWFWDIAARYAVETGAIAMALDHWGQALAEASPELAELFRQRRREVRRGAAVLEARAQLNRGDAARALALLQRLVAEDPQWQPLRSLLQQAEAASRQPSAGFAGMLERAAARIGLVLPSASPDQQSPDQDLEIYRQTLDRFSSTLSEAETRFALES